MNKKDFLSALEKKLSGLSKKELEERLTFYGEMIDDGIEEGVSEEEAVSGVGNIDLLAEQILGDRAVEGEKTKRRKMRAWEIALLAVGSPLWISLLAAAFVILLALCIVLWVLIACVWIVMGVMALMTPISVAALVLFSCIGQPFYGISVLGVGFFCGGIAIFLFLGALYSTKGGAYLMKKLAIAIKRLFVGRGA